ncbi:MULTISPECIES: DnaJ domain-containing protein [Alphaproteobacteria]|uniref:DnaJ domain-containing protein n=1 Tax=Alphaproteobacteria TaxID=28211 RepID=UPI0012BD1B8C|nr:MULTISPECIES: DnaJ domain-containing protein [Alphaproteobacteria]MTI00764.1 J domain-containing protein [Roseibium sp. RKSG952]
MEPVNRIQARVDALEALGLGQSADAEEIRDAWRRIAFHAHPDHTDGDYSNFSNAKAAYDYLRKEGFASKERQGSAQPRRPKLRKRVVELDEDQIEACHILLNPDLAIPYRPDGMVQSNDTASVRDNARASDHVPDAIGCYGRDLTFFVATPVCEGSNRVALPTSILSSCRRKETEILAFQSKSSGSGEVVIPDSIRQSKFPGARSVRIRFEADEQMRDEFWIAS